MSYPALTKMPIFQELFFGADQVLAPTSPASRSGSDSYGNRATLNPSVLQSPPKEKPRKKPGRKPVDEDDDIPNQSAAPVTKRKAQNRAAQRAFRERKEKYVKGLEERIHELEEMVATSKTSPLLTDVVHVEEENKRLKHLVAKLRAENEELKSVYMSSVQDVLTDLYASVAQDTTQQTPLDAAWTPSASSSASDRTLGESPHMLHSASDTSADLSSLFYPDKSLQLQTSQPLWFPQLSPTNITTDGFGGLDQVVSGNGPLFGGKSMTPRTPVAFNSFKDDDKLAFGGYRDPSTALDLDLLLGNDSQSRGLLANGDATLLPGLFETRDPNAFVPMLSKTTTTTTTTIPGFVDPSASTKEKEAAALSGLASPSKVESPCASQVHPLVRVAPELGLLAPAELDDLCDKLKKKCKMAADAVNNAAATETDCPPEVRKTLQRVIDGMHASDS